MSFRLLRQLPAARRATPCLRSYPCRLYSAQPALQLRPDHNHEQPTSHETTTEHIPVEAEPTTRKRRGRPAKQNKAVVEESKPSSSQSPRNPLEPTRVDIYLASLQSEGVEPTLSDLEQRRPENFPHRESTQYVEKYNELADTLCRSFSKTQLQKFVAQCGLRRDRKRNLRKKLDFAEAIIEGKWGWPSLEEVERARRDRTEVLSETFPVTPSQLFLILGRDGANLLQLSMKHNAHISLNREPLELRIEGLRGPLGNLREQLKSQTRRIVEETVQIPTRTAIRPDLVQRISRLAEAYIENIGDEGLIRICAKDQRSLNNAKRLASRASGEVISSTLVPLISYLPAGVPSIADIPEVLSPYTYAMYPFLSPRTLPWYMNTSGAFRVRRVGEWLSQSQGEIIQNTGGLVREQGQLLALDNTSLNLRDTLFTRLPAHTDHQRIVKASMGHVLFSTQSKGQHATLQPPLKGSHQFAKVLNWVSQHDVRASFISSLPASLVHSAPSEQKIAHRLIYKALHPTDQTSNSKKGPSQTNVITFEVVIAQAKDASDADSPHNLSIKPRWQKGSETVVNLMMPDRPMDIRLTALDIETIPEESKPPELRDYSDQLRDFLTYTNKDLSQPDPPLTMHVYGETYMLHTSASVRQSVEQVMPDKHSTEPISVVSESVLDLESGHRTTACEIFCDNPMSEPAWQEFMSGCDELSTAGYRPHHGFSLNIPDSAGV